MAGSVQVLCTRAFIKLMVGSFFATHEYRFGLASFLFANWLHWLHWLHIHAHDFHVNATAHRTTSMLLLTQRLITALTVLLLCYFFTTSMLLLCYFYATSLLLLCSFFASMLLRPPRRSRRRAAARPRGPR